MRIRFDGDIFLRQNPEVFKELSRMCIFHTHHPTSSQFSGMKKKSFEKQGQISREKSLICEKKEALKKWRRENSRSTWFESQCRPSLYQISVEGICPSNKPLSLSGFKERKRSTLFDGALTKYLAKLLQLLLRCGSYVEDTHSHTHTKMEK